MSLTLKKDNGVYIRPDFSEHAKLILSVLWNNSKSGLLCDINLISALDGKKIAAHRAVLSAANEFFGAMFSSNFKEANEKDITLADISADILELIIEYCYTGSININEDNVQLLLPQAQLMLFPEIVKACSNFLLTLLKPTNCLSIAQYAKHYNCDILLKKAEECMNEHFLSLVCTEDFLNLNEEEVAEYLSFDELFVNNEKDVLEALMRWINYDINRDTRKLSFTKLLTSVRLHHIDNSLLLECIKTYSDDEHHFNEMQNEIKEIMLINTMPKRTGPKPNRILIVYQDKISVFDPLTSIVDCEYSIDFNEFIPALVEDKIILVWENNITYFNLRKKAWHYLPPMQTNRISFMVAVLNGYLYVIGGEDEYSVERLDTELYKWSYIASMNIKRESACTAVINGKLYVIGGIADFSLNSVEYYDPVKNEWNFCSPMIEKRAHAKAVVVNGEIYVFGGHNGTPLSCIEKYNPETNTWTKISEMISCRCFFGACLFDKKVILIGGYDGRELLTSMEEYDPVTNTCKLISNELPAHKWEIYLFPYLFTNKFAPSTCK